MDSGAVDSGAVDSGAEDDDARLHAANLAALQVVLAGAGGWPYERGDGWVAADACAQTRFFSFCVLTEPRVLPCDPRPTVYQGRTGPNGWLVMDLWGRPAAGEVRSPVLMRREPGPLDADPRVLLARTPDGLRDAEQALATGLEAPGLEGVLAPGLLDESVAVAYDRALQAVALAFDDGASIGVYLVGTATAARGRGLGAAVTAASLAALPPRPALLTATTMGRPVYERLGFAAVGRATMVLHDRPTTR